MLKKYCWRKNGDYALLTKEKGKYLYFHRLVLDCPKDKFVDHIYQVSHGVCDNRKNNLRIVTKSQNCINTRLKPQNTSGYTGVVWHKNRKKWKARITFKNTCYNLGSFENYNDAIRSRKKAELKYFGEYTNRYQKNLIMTKRKSR